MHRRVPRSLLIHVLQDTNPIFWKTKLEKGEFSNVTSNL